MINMMKTFNKMKAFVPRVRSPHPTHRPLRNMLEAMPFRSVIRFGSVTEYPDTIAKGGRRVELNTVEAIKTSANKKLMKLAFTKDGVKTADWFLQSTVDPTKLVKVIGTLDDGTETVMNTDIPYPIVAKHIFGSRGTGVYLIENQEKLRQWMQGKTLSNYIFEKFYKYNREYRLHVNEDGCFYTCRKVLKKDANKRWLRNDSNSNWVVESNPLFDKPVNWDEIVSECVKALKAIGLDFGAFDVRVQSAKKKDKPRERCEFIVIESNSAPSFGDITLQKYNEMIPCLLSKKANVKYESKTIASPAGEADLESTTESAGEFGDLQGIA